MAKVTGQFFVSTMTMTYPYQSSYCMKCHSFTHIYKFLILTFCCLRSVSASNFKSNNPYEVLGVQRDATQDEIRKTYYKLSLKHHPDKGGSENAFKKIQQAYSEISTPQARQEYDYRSTFTSGSQFSSFPGKFKAGDEFDRKAYEDMMNAFRSSTFGRTQFFRFTPGDIFSRRSPGMFWMPMESSLRMTYVQKVKVSLKDLYRGREGFELIVKNNIWKKYTAAFRGGIAWVLLYQSVLYSLPAIRLSGWLAATLGAFLFHSSLPSLNSNSFYTSIKAGFKSGTKLKFKDADRGIDVIFVLEEENHPMYRREGDNLHLTVYFTPKEVKDGASMKVPALDDDEGDLEIQLSPGDPKRILQIKGRGWPNRRDGNRGDLFIHINIRPTKRQPKAKHSV